MTGSDLAVPPRLISINTMVNCCSSAHTVGLQVWSASSSARAVDARPDVLLAAPAAARGRYALLHFIASGEARTAALRHAALRIQ